MDFIFKPLLKDTLTLWIDDTSNVHGYFLL